MSNAHFEWLIMRCLELQIYKNFRCTFLPHSAFSHSKPNLTTQRNARLHTHIRHPLRTSKRTQTTTHATPRSSLCPRRAERKTAGGGRKAHPTSSGNLPPNSNTARKREPNGSTFLWQQPTRRFAPLPTAPIPRGFGYDPEKFATVRASRLPP